MTRALRALALVCMVASAATAALAQRLPGGITAVRAVEGIDEYRLPNGLQLLLVADDSSATRWRWALAAGAILTAWDVTMEVQMTNVQPAHWVWELQRLPAWVPAWLGRPFFYGMPLTNWVGWYATGSLNSSL